MWLPQLLKSRQVLVKNGDFSGSAFHVYRSRMLDGSLLKATRRDALPVTGFLLWL